MPFSNAAEQQRQTESKALKRCLTYSLAGSLLIHGCTLFLKLNLARNSEEPVSEEIAIIVTEPLTPLTEAEPENAISTGDFSAGGGGSNSNSQPVAESLAESPTPALLDAPAVSSSSEESLLQDSTSPEAPLSQAQPSVQTPQQSEAAVPTPVPSPLPTAESLTEEEKSIENAPEDTQVESAPVASTNPPTSPETLRNWLAELRRNRERSRGARWGTRSSGSSGGDRPTDGESENSGNGNGIATRTGGRDGQTPNAPGFGTGTRSGTNQGAGRRTGTGPDGEGTGERSGEADTPRQIACRNCPKPEYPAAALESGAEGSVRVNVEVDENGRVIGVSLVGSSGNAALDQAVLETVREQYEFEGVGTGGATIPVEVDMTLEGSDLNRRARERGDRTSIETPASAPEPIESTATEPAVAPTEPIPKPTSVSPPAAPVPTPEPASAIAEPTPSLSPSEPVLEETPAASPEQVSPVEPAPSVSENDSEPLLPAATPLPAPLAEPDHAVPLPASSSTESIDLPPSAPAAIPSESPIPSAPPE